MTSRITDALLPAPDATDLPAVETTTRLRPVPAVDRPSGPPARPQAPTPAAAPPAAPLPPHRPTPAPATPAQAAVPPRPAGPPDDGAAPPTPAPRRALASPTGPTGPGAQPPSGPGRPAGAPAGPTAAGAPRVALPAGTTTAPPRPTTAPAAPTDTPARPTAAPHRPVAPARPPVAPARPAAGPGGPGTAPGPRPGTAPGPRPGTAAGSPGPAPHAAVRTAAPYRGPGALPPEAPVEITTRLRPVRERRPGRTLAVAACAVLGFGLIGGALAGVWLAASEPGKPAEPVGYAEAEDLWHNAPVDTLFPRTLAGPGAGPGGADRTWTRIVVAPDAACTPAVLSKALRATVEPLGCERVLRATYTDATTTSVITVGLVFTRADAATQRTLGRDLTTRLGADVPPALAGPGTVAARFGAPQRAAWWLNAPVDLPVVVTAVSGFADGRTVDGGPVPADRAMTANRTDATAQSGLGHEAKGITERLVRLLRTAATAAAKENAR
ncbi:hypothetical protein ACH4ZU_21710 [Streptomyces sp. NPDC020472]|uniref:hypothetical protein n=1 Tax=Streptomyces sp. NPDC020472 TaxID=3365075 RepID=UPI0037ACB1E8